MYYRGKINKNEINDFTHKEQAYVEMTPRDVIPFRYTESLQM